MHILKGKQWRRAVEFEENPRTMSLGDIIHFAYKYYYRSPLLPSTPDLDNHFEQHYQSTAYPEDSISISIGGDLMPYEMIKPEHVQNLWDEVGEDFFGSDLVFANLETPLDSSKPCSFVPEVMLNDMHFNTDARTFEIFCGNGKYKGYDVLSVANNHSMDMDEEGLDATMDYLKSRGIDYVGAKHKESDPDYVIRVCGGIRVGFVAYTYSLNQLLPPEGKDWKVNYLRLNTMDCPIDRIVRNVKACREAGAEYVICSLHGGNAYQAYPSKVTVDLFKRVFDETGVDLIAGGHPHNLQPWREYSFADPFTNRSKTGFAIYSLADFIAYDIYTWCHLSAYLKVRLWRESGVIRSSIEVKPMVMTRQDGQLSLLYARPMMEKRSDSNELQDIGILYDICVNNLR